MALLVVLVAFVFAADASEFCSMRGLCPRGQHLGCSFNEKSWSLVRSGPIPMKRSSVIEDVAKEEILRLHNAFRRYTARGVNDTQSPPRTVANMRELRWSEELAYLARVRVTLFNIARSGADCANLPRYQVGMNQHTQSFPVAPSESTPWPFITKYWYSYSRFVANGLMTDLGAFRDLAQFSQMLWPTTYEVGCAANNFVMPGAYMRNVICYYGPVARCYDDTNPFILGTPASRCPDGTMPNDGLCGFTTETAASTPSATTTTEAVTTTELEASTTAEPSTVTTTTIQTAEGTPTPELTTDPTTEPVPTILEPITTTTEPITTTPELIIITTELNTTTPEAVTTTTEPIATTPVPIIITTELNTTPEAVTTATEPITTTPVPIIITTELITTTPEAVTTATEPIVTTPELIITTNELIATTPEAVTTTTEPITATEISTTMPTAGSSQLPCNSTATDPPINSKDPQEILIAVLRYICKLLSINPPDLITASTVAQIAAKTGA